MIDETTFVDIVEYTYKDLIYGSPVFTLESVEAKIVNDVELVEVIFIEEYLIVHPSHRQVKIQLVCENLQSKTAKEFVVHLKEQLFKSLEEKK